MPLFSDPTLAYKLAHEASQNDLRNRSIPVEAEWSPTFYSTPTCKCGNFITIEDTGYKCRDCRRAGR